MKQIWRYPIHDRYQILKVPKMVENHPGLIVHADFLYGKPQLWIMVDPDLEYQDLYVAIYGTGDEIPEDHRFRNIASIIDQGDPRQPFAWHLFDFHTPPDSLREIYEKLQNAQEPT